MVSGRQRRRQRRQRRTAAAAAGHGQAPHDAGPVDTSVRTAAACEWALGSCRAAGSGPARLPGPPGRHRRLFSPFIEASERCTNASAALGRCTRREPGSRRQPQTCAARLLWEGLFSGQPVHLPGAGRPKAFPPPHAGRHLPRRCWRAPSTFIAAFRFILLIHLAF